MSINLLRNTYNFNFRFFSRTRGAFSKDMQHDIYVPGSKRTHAVFKTDLFNDFIGTLPIDFIVKSL